MKQSSERRPRRAFWVSDDVMMMTMMIPLLMLLHLVTAIPVDASCGNVNSYRVYVSKDGDICDAPLSFTDMKASVFGSNQFCLIQLVELTPEANKHRLANMQSDSFTFRGHLGLPKYRVIECWGRVGAAAQSRVRGYNR